MKPFPRRLYASFSDFWQDIRFVMQNRQTVKIAMHGDMISKKFQERLMLMVTEVNGCRYCSYYHAKEALKAGISNDELAALMEGSIPKDTPKDEIPALLFAQYWAEVDAKPDPEIQQKFVNTYGAKKSEAIAVILRMIRVGNLSGNLWDYILYRISFGRWGLLEDETAN
jgi:AhpD family alkylhydroperoxidase